MKLLQYDEQSDLSINRKQVKLLVEEFFRLKTTSSKSVIVHFVSKEVIAKIHAIFFQDPTPTDCITFPIREPDLLGEIFICPQMAIDYFPHNPHKETTLYIVHALLHLLGYDDINLEERKKMREAEEIIMKHLSQENLILSV